MGDASPDRLAAAIDSIDEATFGEFVAALWIDLGWETQVVGDGDGYTDVLAVDPDAGRRKLVRSLDDGRTIAGNEVRRLLDDGLDYEDLDDATLLSTGSVTDGATEPPGADYLTLIDGDELVEFVRTRGLRETVFEYADSAAGPSAGAAFEWNGGNRSAGNR